MRAFPQIRFLTPLALACAFLAGGTAVRAVDFNRSEVIKRPTTILQEVDLDEYYPERSRLKVGPRHGPKHYFVPRSLALKKASRKPSKRGGGRGAIHPLRGSR